MPQAAIDTLSVREHKRHEIASLIAHLGDYEVELSTFDLGEEDGVQQGLCDIWCKDEFVSSVLLEYLADIGRLNGVSIQLGRLRVRLIVKY